MFQPKSNGKLNQDQNQNETVPRLDAEVEYMQYVGQQLTGWWV